MKKDDFKSGTNISAPTVFNVNCYVICNAGHGE